MKTVKIEMPKLHWDVLVKLAASYHGHFTKSAGEWYSTEDVLMMLSEEEHNALNELFD